MNALPEKKAKTAAPTQYINLKSDIPPISDEAVIESVKSNFSPVLTDIKNLISDIDKVLKENTALESVSDIESCEKKNKNLLNEIQKCKEELFQGGQTRKEQIRLQEKEVRLKNELEVCTTKLTTCTKELSEARQELSEAKNSFQVCRNKLTADTNVAAACAKQIATLIPDKCTPLPTIVETPGKKVTDTEEAKIAANLVQERSSLLPVDDATHIKGETAVQEKEISEEEELVTELPGCEKYTKMKKMRVPVQAIVHKIMNDKTLVPTKKDACNRLIDLSYVSPCPPFQKMHSNGKTQDIIFAEINNQVQNSDLPLTFQQGEWCKQVLDAQYEPKTQVIRSRIEKDISNIMTDEFLQRYQGLRAALEGEKKKLKKGKAVPHDSLLPPKFVGNAQILYRKLNLDSAKEASILSVLRFENAPSDVDCGDLQKTLRERISFDTLTVLESMVKVSSNEAKQFVNELIKLKRLKMPALIFLQKLHKLGNPEQRILFLQFLNDVHQFQTQAGVSYDTMNRATDALTHIVDVVKRALFALKGTYPGKQPWGDSLPPPIYVQGLLCNASSVSNIQIASDASTIIQAGNVKFRDALHLEGIVSICPKNGSALQLLQVFADVAKTHPGTLPRFEDIDLNFAISLDKEWRVLKAAKSESIHVTISSIKQIQGIIADSMKIRDIPDSIVNCLQQWSDKVNTLKLDFYDLLQKYTNVAVHVVSKKRDNPVVDFAHVWKMLEAVMGVWNKARLYSKTRNVDSLKQFEKKLNKAAQQNAIASMYSSSLSIQMPSAEEKRSKNVSDLGGPNPRSETPIKQGQPKNKSHKKSEAFALERVLKGGYAHTIF